MARNSTLAARIWLYWISAPQDQTGESQQNVGTPIKAILALNFRWTSDMFEFGCQHWIWFVRTPDIKNCMLAIALIILPHVYCMTAHVRRANRCLIIQTTSEHQLTSASVLCGYDISTFELLCRYGDCVNAYLLILIVYCTWQMKSRSVQHFALRL